MADRVVLHVGLLKTGTSYIQQRLMAGHASLEEHGVLFPPWRDQVDAVVDVLEIQRRPRPEVTDGAWDRLVERLDRWPGTGLVSMEFLGPAREPRIEQVVSSFGSTPVEVVLTARDLNRVLLAMWQETAKNFGTEPWPSYLEGVREDSGAGRRFWRQQRLGILTRRWASVVGIENVTVVTVPPPGSPTETLWDRFCEAARIDPALCPSISPTNESVGAASAEILRRVNEELAGWDVPWPAYSKVVKFGFAKEVLTSMRAEEPALGMPVPEWLVRRSESMRGNVAQTGVRVVGDLADLTPVAVPGLSPADVPAEDQVGVAVQALARILRRELERELDAPLDRRTEDTEDTEGGTL